MILNLSANGLFADDIIVWNVLYSPTFGSYTTAFNFFDTSFKDSDSTFDWNTPFALTSTEIDDYLLTITQLNSGYPTTDSIATTYSRLKEGTVSVSAIGSVISGNPEPISYIYLGEHTFVFDEGPTYGELQSLNVPGASGTIDYATGAITLDTLTSGFSAGYIAATYVRSTGTYFISLTAKSNQSFYIYASGDQLESETLTEEALLAASSFAYTPLQLIVTTIPGTETSNSIGVTSYWSTISGDYYPLSGSYIRWDAIPTTNLNAEIFSTPYSLGNRLTLDTTLTSTSAFFTTSETELTYYTITPTVSDNDILITYRSPGSLLFIANSHAKYNIASRTVNTIYLSAYYDNTTREFPPDFRLRWKVYPYNTQNVLISSPGDPNFTIESDGYGPSLPYGDSQYVFVSSKNWSGTYDITVSGSDGITWTNNIPFRPFLYLSGATQLSATVIKTGELVPTTYLTLNVYGVSTIDGIDQAFNLYDDQLLMYGNKSIYGGLVAYNRWYDTIYTFVPEVGPISTDTAYNIDPLRLEVTTSTVSTTPQLSTYQITVSAVESVDSSLILDYDIIFDVSEWVSDSLFYPAFSVNNELSSTHILYRDQNELVFPWVITIHNHTTAPTDATGNLKFVFSNGDVSAQPVGFTSFTHEVPNGYSTYTIQICGDSISASTWPTPITKVGDTKTINILSDFPAVDFAIYPEYKWDDVSETFVPVLCNQSITPGPCAWGYCHTEIFTLSAHPETDASYIWYVEDVTPYPFGETSNLVSVAVQSTSATETHSVSCKLVNPDLPIDMPNYHYDDTTGLPVLYKNFTTTDIDKSNVKQPIKMVSMFDYLSTSNTVISYNPFGVNAHNLVLDIGPVFSVSVPIEINQALTSTWGVSTYQWSETYTTAILPKTISFTVSSEGERLETVSQYSPTVFNIESNVIALISPVDLTAPFSAWCIQPINLSTTYSTATAYPLKPAIYTSNLYTVTGELVAFENVLPVFNLIQKYTWTDRGNTWISSTKSPYITVFTNPGDYDISLKTTYTGYGLSSDETVVFNNVVNVVNQFELFDPNIERVYEASRLVLPNRIDQCRVPANEWITDWNINKSFNNLEENVTYLSDKSKLYDAPPTTYYGWLGTMYDGVSGFFHWRVDQPGINLGYDLPLQAESGYFNNLTDCVVRSVNGIGDNIHFVSNKTSVKILSSDMFATEIAERTFKGIGDDFINVQAIDLDADFDTDKRIYILDSGKYRVLVFNYDFELDRWRLMYSWGGLGGANSKNKFYDPTDLLVTDKNQIWVTDYNNLCIKKYARTGTWLGTFKSDIFNSKNKPISTALDVDNNIYVLTQTGIYKFDSSFNYIDGFKLPQLENETAKRLTICRDGGFLYLCTDQSILKVTFDGVIIGIFATEYGGDYKSCYHDLNRNLYIVSTNAIVKYVDKLDIINLRTDVTSLWPMSSIHIEPNEYNQDWVINRSFARYWDNLEVFRRSIIGRFTYDVINDIPVPTVRTFTPQEYKLLPYTKNQIYVGINEIVTADAINRCFDKLYACQETILDMIRD